jgi:hypothetical protein
MAGPAFSPARYGRYTTGWSLADSFILDPRQWLFTPFDCCALLYRERKSLPGAKPADVDTAANAVAWFRDCAAAFPEIGWTHLYSPRYLLVEDGIDAVFTPYLLDAMQNEGAEIGIHAHLYFDMVGPPPGALGPTPVRGRHAAD